MKKLICVVLILLLPVVALADVDLASMPYDELMTLHRSIVAEIMSRPEWKEVTVPPGIYVIGEDIPVGSYSLECVDHNSIIETNKIGSARSDFYNVLGNGETVGKVELKEGYTIRISGTVIFRPPVLLGF